MDGARLTARLGGGPHGPRRPAVHRALDRAVGQRGVELVLVCRERHSADRRCRRGSSSWRRDRSSRAPVLGRRRDTAGSRSPRPAVRRGPAQRTPGAAFIGRDEQPLLGRGDDARSVGGIDRQSEDAGRRSAVQASRGRSGRPSGCPSRCRSRRSCRPRIPGHESRPPRAARCSSSSSRRHATRSARGSAEGPDRRRGARSR